LKKSFDPTPNPLPKKLERGIKPHLETVFSPFLHAVGRRDAGNHAVRRGGGDRSCFYNYIAKVTNLSETNKIRPEDINKC